MGESVRRGLSGGRGRCSEARRVAVPAQKKGTISPAWQARPPTRRRERGAAHDSVDGWMDLASKPGQVLATAQCGHVMWQHVHTQQKQVFGYTTALPLLTCCAVKPPQYIRLDPKTSCRSPLTFCAAQQSTAKHSTGQAGAVPGLSINNHVHGGSSAAAHQEKAGEVHPFTAGHCH